MNSVGKKTLKRFVHELQGFAKAVVQTTNNLGLAVDEDGSEELGPEEPTIKEVLEQELVAEGEAGEQDTAGEREEPLRKFTVRAQQALWPASQVLSKGRKGFR